MFAIVTALEIHGPSSFLGLIPYKPSIIINVGIFSFNQRYRTAINSGTPLKQCVSNVEIVGLTFTILGDLDV